MVGHQEKQPQEPPSPFVVEPGRVQHRSRRIQKRPSAPLLRIDGHELHHRPCHRKRRRPMRQLPPHGQRVVGRALRASRGSIARIPPARLARSARPTLFSYSPHHPFSSFRAWWGELSERAAGSTAASLPCDSHGVLALPSSHTVPIISSPRSGRGGASSPSEPLFQPPHPFRTARTECSPHHHVFPHHPACHGLDGAPRSFGSSATSVQPQIHRPSEIHWAASTWNAPWRGSPRRYSSANRSGGYSSR